jgi:peptidoglycan/LPS O-acetylase OafA/YrhL
VGWYFSARKTLISAVAGSVGVLLLCMFFWLAFRRRPEPAPHRMALLAVATFVVAMTLLTAAGRVGFGIDQAVTSRYATPILAFWLSLAVLAMAHFGVTVKHQALVMLACLPLQLLILASQQIYVARGDTLQTLVPCPFHFCSRMSMIPRC